MNPGCRFRIESSENAVQMFDGPLIGPAPQPNAKLLRAGGAFEETFEQSAQVEPSSSNYDRQRSAVANISDGLSSQA